MEAQRISEKAPVLEEGGPSPCKLPELSWDLPQAAKPRGGHSPLQVSKCRGRLGLEQRKVKAFYFF